MDPITTATAFASIVGLISNFKSERSASSEHEYQDFINWLSNKRHESIMSEITSNKTLSLGIESLLNQNHEVVLQKLFKLDEMLLLISSSINGLNNISTALAPNLELSQQAISILNQVNSGGNSGMTEFDDEYTFMDTMSDLDVDEPQFIKDDLEQLINLNLLLSGFSANGKRTFRITRLAVKLIAQM